ncbi:lactose ABC transporter permease [Clostridia bacterium]|nr:lactose ABC transporter permease [Clostridia bacterium]
MKRHGLSMSNKKAITGLLFISPFIIGFVAFYLRGLAQTVMFSFSELTRLDEGGFTTTFVGWKNYIFALTEHADFKQRLVESTYNMWIDVVLVIFFSLFIAILLNQKFRGRTLARAIFFLPVILNSQAISEAMDMARALMMGGGNPASPTIMDATTGAAGSVNIQYYINLLGDLAIPRQALDYIVGAVDRINTIITASGVQIVIFIAALQSVPGSLYEVSRIEGATAYETFWKVTFPMVAPLIVTNIVYTVVDSFVNSDIMQLSNDTIFNDHNYGLSSVFGLISMLVVCATLMLVTTIISKRTFYQN